MKKIIMLGAGGHARVLSSFLESQSKNVHLYVATDKPSFSNASWIEESNFNSQDFPPSLYDLVNGVGSVDIPNIRSKLFKKYKLLGYNFLSVIHEKCLIEAGVCLGEGVQLMLGCILQSGVRLGDNVIVNSGAILDHDVSVGHHSHIAPGVTISGNVKIGDFCHIGTGAVIIQGCEIGNETLVGAGAVVLKNSKGQERLIGIPAKRI
jgi:sugar O-acyltransferase (sialic acid O-acetyltransferase NeuD family)